MFGNRSLFSELLHWGTAMTCLWLMVVWSTPVFGQTEASASETWVLTGLDGQKQNADVTAIESGEIQKADESKLDLASFGMIETSHALLGADPSATEVQLIHGGVAFAREISLASGTVTIETDVSELHYDIFDLRCVIFQKATGQEELEKLLAEPSSEVDRLLVTTSQGPRTVSGLIDSIDKESVSIDYKGEVRSIGLDKVIALLPAQLDSGRKLLGVLTTIDRSCLLVESLTFDGNQWTVVWGPNEIKVDASSVAKLSIRSDRQVYLSDLLPERKESQSRLAPGRPVQMDANVFGQPITLSLPAESSQQDVSVADTDDGSLVGFSKGIGCQARTHLVYSVPAEMKQLAGWVGIDPAASPHGDCVCSILVDGIQVFSQRVKGDAVASAINLPLENATRIEILVEPGHQFDLSDWVNWADLRFLK